VLEKESYPPRIVYQLKLKEKIIEGEIRTFSGKQKLGNVPAVNLP
jgi:hypothetical protein